MIPLSKLDGINVNKLTRTRLPHLEKITSDSIDDLEWAANELVNPSEDIKNTHSWKISRLHFLAAYEMAKRTAQIEQAELGRKILTTHREALRLADAGADYTVLYELIC